MLERLSEKKPFFLLKVSRLALAMHITAIARNRIAVAIMKSQ
jgi:hypothetical protein